MVVAVADAGVVDVIGGGGCVDRSVGDGGVSSSFDDSVAMTD